MPGRGGGGGALRGIQRRPRGGAHPYRPPVFRSVADPAAAGAAARRLRPTRGCGTSWARTGCCWTASCCRGRSRPRICCATSTPSVGAAARAALPVAVRELAAAAARGYRRVRAAGQNAGPAPQRRGVHRGLPALLLADGRARAAYGSRRFRCWRPRARPITNATTGGTSRSPTGWSRRPRIWCTPPAGSSSTSPIPESTAAGVGWWEELTGAGGEGMVVKPWANLTRPGGGKALVQPGVKVRGREYLRIIYGPDYTETTNLERLRERNLGHKRSMALREYALGLEALDRVARRRTAAGGCTNRCSQSWRWNPSRSTHASELTPARSSGVSWRPAPPTWGRGRATPATGRRTAGDRGSSPGRIGSRVRAGSGAARRFRCLRR